MKEKYLDKLKSERLITRKLTETDIAVWVDFFADPESLEYLPKSGLNSNIEKARQWVERQLGRYKNNNFGLQALIDKETGNFIGQCGLLKQEVDGKKELEVSYHILKKYRGKGYAPEAASLFIDYAFENNLTDSVISIIDIRNVKSQRVAEKNGLRIDKQTKWRDMDIYIYRIDRGNWKESRH